MLQMKTVTVPRKLALVCVEIFILLVYVVYSIGSYAKEEITFGLDDMELQDMGHDYSKGAYLDVSYADQEAVVTPKMQLKKGIYYIEASYAEQGIAMAGLIYEEDREGSYLVDDDEFMLNPETDSLSYRVRVHDDAAIRFKVRLNHEASGNDYVQLLQVHIVSSKLTYVYPIFCMAMFLLLLDLLLCGYFKYYRVWNSEQKVVFLTLAFMAFFMGLPMYRNGIAEPENVDLRFHLQRMEGVYRGLLAGQFPVRIQPEWLNGYGYASSIFYGDIFMYFPAILRIVGFTLQDAFKCYLGVVNIAAVFISFYAFRKITKNDLAAMTGSILYAGNTTNLALVYRAMIGGYSAMVFYPLIIAGFYLIFSEDVSGKEYKKIWLLLTAGFSGLLLTHMISCLIVGGYSILCCILMIKKVLRKQTLFALIKAACVTVLLNLWFLVPFINYMLSEKIHINQDLERNLEGSDYYALLSSFMGKGNGRNLYNLFLDPQYHIDYALLIVLLLYVVTISMHKKSIMTKHSRILFAFTILAFWVCTDLFPVVEVARIHPVFLKCFLTMQYQYRFFNIAIAIAACLSAMFFAMNVFERKNIYIVAGLICCITLYQDFEYFKTVNVDDIYLDYIDMEIMQDNFKIGNAEYLPVETDIENLTQEVECDELLQIKDIKRQYLTFDICVENITGQERNILLPVLYYSGYRALDIQSKEMLKTVKGDNGRVCVTVPADYNGTFHMAFYEPWFWRVSEIISFMTMLFIAYTIIKRKGNDDWNLKKIRNFFQSQETQL